MDDADNVQHFKTHPKSFSYKVPLLDCAIFCQLMRRIKRPTWAQFPRLSTALNDIIWGFQRQFKVWLMILWASKTWKKKGSWEFFIQSSIFFYESDELCWLFTKMVSGILVAFLWWMSSAGNWKPFSCLIDSSSSSPALWNPSRGFFFQQSSCSIFPFEGETKQPESIIS